MEEDNYIIGTAGHIDHGKTELIKALTGEDTDRLEEEKKRGISIDLGFTRFTLPDGRSMGIIDVPGHEKFIKNMLAGAGGVDLALLVIDATEGVREQTKEHLAILDLLGVEYGIVAITKIDLVENPEWLELVEMEAREEIADTFLAGASIIPVSSPEGAGIEELKAEIEKIAGLLPPKKVAGNVYLPLDRVFSLQGHGTIVTGTLIQGRVETGGELVIYPRQKEVRVRTLQVHGEEREVAFPGQRVGINLTGVDTGEIERGNVLAAPGTLKPTRYIDGRLRVINDLDFVIEHGDRIRFHIGADEVIGRVYLLDRETLTSGESGLVQYRLEEKIVALYDERYVVRRYSPMTTVGGGSIIDNHPPYRKRFDREALKELEIMEQGNSEKRVEIIVKSYPEPVSTGEVNKKATMALTKLGNTLRKLRKEGKVHKFTEKNRNLWLHNDVYKQILREIRGLLGRYHEKYSLRPGMLKEELRTRLTTRLDKNIFNQLLVKAGSERVRFREPYICLPGFRIEYSPREEKIKNKIIALYSEHRFTPPGKSEIISLIDGDDFNVEEVFNALYRTGKLKKISEDIYFTTGLLTEAEEILRDYLDKKGKIEAAAYRDLLDSSRKYAIALLEYFDRKGLTVRKGDRRVLAQK